MKGTFASISKHFVVSANTYLYYLIVKSMYHITNCVTGNWRVSTKQKLLSGSF